MSVAVGGLGAGMLIESQEMALGSFMLFSFGAIVFVLSILWHLYRIVRGWIALANSNALP